VATKIQSHETPEQIRLQKAIAEAKGLGTYPDINWDDVWWDITKFEKPRAHEKGVRTLYFSPRSPVGKTRRKDDVSYEQPFADFAKAIIRTRASERGLSFKGQTHMIGALRFLYDSLHQTGTSDPTLLTRKTFAMAIAAVRTTTKGWTIYHMGRALEEIARWIDEREITQAEINFLNPIPCPGNGDGLDAESQARGLLKMPSAAAIEALAEISQNPTNEKERIVIRIIDLLVIGAFRIGEVLTLPLDCWVETPALDDSGEVKKNPLNGEPIIRCGIRYWPEKGGLPYLKWLPDIAVPVAKRAVTELAELCSEARLVARTLETHPNRVPLPGVKKADQLLSRLELMQILGLREYSAVGGFLKRIGVTPYSRKRKGRGHPTCLHRAKDVEKALLKRRGELLILRRPGGKFQTLSQSLCVMFKNQFRSRAATLRFLPELIGVGPIRDALGNRNAGSVFEIRGLTEPDGSPLVIKTHAFRHWLNTLLDRGGLSDVELARWSGRRSIDQNAAYKHGTVEQRVSWARDMIREGKLQGPAADIYHSINDPVEKEQFLATFVNVALFTPYGVCIHDYALDPCPYHLNCLGGCSEYLRTKGDKDEEKNIKAVRDFHLVQLQRVKAKAVKNAGKIQNYKAHCGRIVKGAKAALADDLKNVPDGKLVKVFPKGKRMGKPITML
jgi:hypothetical protein